MGQACATQIKIINGRRVSVKVKCKEKKPHNGGKWHQPWGVFKHGSGGAPPVHRDNDDDYVWVWNVNKFKWERVKKKDYKPNHPWWRQWDHNRTKDRWGRHFTYSDAADWYGLQRYGQGPFGPDDVNPRYTDWGIGYYQEYGSRGRGYGDYSSRDRFGGGRFTGPSPSTYGGYGSGDRDRGGYGNRDRGRGGFGSPRMS